MRNLQKTLAFFGILAISSIGQLVGCSNDAGNCELNYETCPASGSSSSSGMVIPTPPGCEEVPSQNPEVIRTDCAYFVGGSKGSDSNTGGETDPFLTLGAALNAAKGQKGRVYLCGNVTERVDIPAGVSVFGGFDCSSDDWKYDASKPGSISPSAPEVGDAFQSSVRIKGGGKTNIEDIDITAVDATSEGGSSIAVIVDSATVDFVRVKLTSGNARDGAAGIAPTADIGPTSSTDPLIVGNDGAAACAGGSGGNPGGQAKPNPICNASVGGMGGMGKDLTAADPGDPGLPMASGFGGGGFGEDTAECTPGSQGGNGKSGNSGAGGTQIGVISDTGYAGAAGMAGESGTPGQGGGGGGGARGKTNCNGASGASGGAGGCGGNGGGGGNAGGSSIGIISVGGTLTFSSVTITTAKGGNGGDGVGGQNGATGGIGGTGGAKNGSTAYGCDGGKGGRGGDGGTGGGGRGGHSVGIAFKGNTNAPNASGASIQTGTPGLGGTGDGSTSGDGSEGVQGETQVFE